MGVGRNSYEKTKIGEEASIVAATGATVGIDSSVSEPLERFKDVIKEVEQLELAGLVTIIEKHLDTCSGGRYVDIIRFRRLR
jgi:tetrahydromethanopterin S-methyltransferase subunit A